MSRLISKPSAESWWIDYIEGELKDKDRELAQTILEKSPVDQLIVTNLEKLKSSLKDIDEKWVHSQEVDWRSLEERIFLKIKKTKPEWDKKRNSVAATE